MFEQDDVLGQAVIDSDETRTEEEQARRYAEDAMADAETCDDVCEALEAIALSLEASLVDGGMQPQEARFATFAIDAQLARIGMPRVGISTESFGGTMTREDATRASLESVTDTLKKLWEAIVVMVKRAWASIQRFFAQLFGSAQRLKSYAETLLAQAESLDHHQPASKYIELGERTSHQLIMGLRVNRGVINQFSEVTKKLEEMSESFTSRMQSVTDAMVRVLDKHDFSALREVQTAHNDILHRIMEHGGQRDETPAEIIFRSRSMPGNTRLWVRTTGFMDQVDEAKDLQDKLALVADGFSKMRFDLVVDAPPGRPLTAMDTLSPEEIKSLARAVIAVCDWSMRFDKTITAAADHLNQQMAALGRKEIYLVGNALEEKNWLRLERTTAPERIVGQDAQKNITAIHTSDVFRAFGRTAINVARPAMLLQGYALKLSRAMANAAHKSLVEYQKGSAQSDEPLSPEKQEAFEMSQRSIVTKALNEGRTVKVQESDGSGDEIVLAPGATMAEIRAAMSGTKRIVLR